MSDVQVLEPTVAEVSVGKATIAKQGQPARATDAAVCAGALQELRDHELKIDFMPGDGINGATVEVRGAWRSRHPPFTSRYAELRTQACSAVGTKRREAEEEFQRVSPLFAEYRKLEKQVAEIQSRVSDTDARLADLDKQAKEAVRKGKSGLDCLREAELLKGERAHLEDWLAEVRQSRDAARTKANRAIQNVGINVETGEEQRARERRQALLRELQDKIAEIALGLAACDAVLSRR